MLARNQSIRLRDQLSGEARGHGWSSPKERKTTGTTGFKLIREWAGKLPGAVARIAGCSM